MFDLLRVLSNFPPHGFFVFFFFNDTATTEIYTLSLHDALPIWCRSCASCGGPLALDSGNPTGQSCRTDRKSTRLNSSQQIISYAVFCLKKKKYHNTYLQVPHSPYCSSPHTAQSSV